VLRLCGKALAWTFGAFGFAEARACQAAASGGSSRELQDGAANSELLWPAIAIQRQRTQLGSSVGASHLLQLHNLERNGGGHTTSLWAAGPEGVSPSGRTPALARGM